MALYDFSDKLKKASGNVKKQLDSFSQTDAGKSIKSALQNISPFPGQETSLRGVTGNTKDKLNQYSGDYQAYCLIALLSFQYLCRHHRFQSAL